MGSNKCTKIYLIPEKDGGKRDSNLVRIFNKAKETSSSLGYNDLGLEIASIGEHRNVASVVMVFSSKATFDEVNALVDKILAPVSDSYLKISFKPR